MNWLFLLLPVCCCCCIVAIKVLLQLYSLRVIPIQTGGDYCAAIKMDNENQQDRRRRSRMDNNDDGQDGGGHRDGGGKKRPIEGGDYSGSPQKKGSFMNGKLMMRKQLLRTCEI